MPRNPSELISCRANSMDASGIRKAFDLAQSLENPINLSIGQADYDVPEEMKNFIAEAAKAGKNRYTVTQGAPRLREKIRQVVKRDLDYEPEEIIVTAGGSGGLCLAVMALVDHGDHILIPDPYFVMYKQLTLLAEAQPVFINTYPDFKLTAERVEAAITPKSKILILNSPCNPTGAVIPSDELKAIAEVADRHDLVVISDEVYSFFSYDVPHDSIARYYENTILVQSFSKTYGMTGWRIGYAAGPHAILQEMMKIQQFTFVCAPSIVQEAMTKGLDIDMSHHIERYRRKREIVCSGLKDRFELVEPAGAFYVFPRAPWGTGQTFCIEAIKNNVIVVPGGNVFSEQDTHFRISYSAPEEDLVEGVRILNELAEDGPR